MPRQKDVEGLPLSQQTSIDDLERAPRVLCQHLANEWRRKVDNVGRRLIATLRAPETLPTQQGGGGGKRMTAC